MITYNKKCKGCGVYLTSNKDDQGYVPKFDQQKTKYCYRCFRLINYNELNNENLNEQIQDKISELDFTNKQVFLVIDILDIKGSIINLNETACNIIIIVNKTDLIPKDYNFQEIYKRIRDNINDCGIKYSKIVFSSIKSKSSIKQINELIIKAGKKKMKSIFVGKSNVGKSSLINGLLSLHQLNPTLTTSNSTNTTISLQKIKLGKDTIIDTPGFIATDNLLNFIDYHKIKTVMNKRTIKPINYQLKYPKQINIENIISIQAYPIKNNGTITIYMSNTLKTNSSKIKETLKFKQKNLISYLDNDDNNFVLRPFILHNSKRSNICISGLGMIVCQNIESVKIFINKNVLISVLQKTIL